MTSSIEKRVDLGTNKVMPQIDKIVSKYHYVDVLGIPNRDEVIKRIPCDSVGDVIRWDQQTLAEGVYLDRNIEFDFQEDFTFPFPAVVDISQAANQIFGAPGAITTFNGLNVRPGVITSVLGNICLSYLPVFSQANNVAIQINSQQLTYTPSKYMRAMSRFNGNDKWDVSRESASPLFKDYSVFENKPVGLLDEPSYNPFLFGDLDYPRRGEILPVFIYYVIPVLGNPDECGSVIIRYAWIEKCPLAPLTNLEVGGFYNINSIGVQITPSDIKRNISINPAFYATLQAGPFNMVDYTAAFTNLNDQKMRLYTITSKFARNKCETNFLPSERYNPTTKNIGVLAPGQSVTIENNSIALNKQCSKFYIYCNRAGENYNSRDADIYGLITGLSIVYNNKSDYFNQFSQYDIYEQFVKNKGYRVPYSVYSRFSGGPCLLEAADFYGLCGVAGSPITANFQASVTVKNVTNQNLDLQLVVVQVYDQMISYNNNSFIANDIIVDTEAVLEKARITQLAIPTEMLTPVGLCMSGGSVKDDLINAGAKALSLADSVSKFYLRNKDYIDPLIQAGVGTAKDVFTSLIAAGLTPDLAYYQVSNYSFPQSDLKKIQQSMYQAGCMSCNFDELMGGTVSFGSDMGRQDFYVPATIMGSASGMKKKATKKRAGVLIEEDDEFDNYQSKPIKRMSLRERY